MDGNLYRINRWLLPLSWLYGLGVRLRNRWFDIGWLKSKSFDLPIISVGNITVGGTGKTPHTEYLIQLLQEQYQVAVLSRGYKRKGKGFKVANTDTPMKEIGDEPWQMKNHFPNVHVVTDANRCRGIRLLRQDPRTSNTQVVLLDDAYQHRYVKPGLNILLIDYNRPIAHDRMLPAGRLREPEEEKFRADLVIVTKCPQRMTPIEVRLTRNSLGLHPHQQVFFSTLQYKDMEAVFHCSQKPLGEEKEHILLWTGIGNPRQMKKDLAPHVLSITEATYPDHHYYTKEDVRHINETLENMPQPRIVVTTEKDAARIRNLKGLSKEVRENLYALPIQVKFLKDQKTFNNIISDYVRKNSRNG